MLFQWTGFYLRLNILELKFKLREKTTGTTFIITGIDLNNEVVTENISGSNAGIVITTIVKSVTSINSSGTSNGQIKIGTKAADGN